MKKLILMLAMVLPMVFVSCSDEEDDSVYMERICGVWEEYGNTLGYEVFHLELKPDGTGNRWAEDYGEIDEQGKTPFSWSANESELVVTTEDGDIQRMSYELDGDRLSVSFEGETIVYVKE